MPSTPPARLPHNRSVTAVKTLLVIILLIGSYLLGFRQGAVGGTSFLHALFASKAQTPADFSELNDVWDLLQKEFVNAPIDRTKAVYGAIQGMVESLGDPYTTFFTPDETTKFQQEIDGAFEGVGTEIGIKEDHLVIIAPLPNSPAERAGLMAGDWITSIDDTGTDGMALDDAVGMIRGPKGTKVTLTIVRGEEEARKVEIVREEITVQSVKHTALAHGFDELALSYFGPDTGKEFSDAVSGVLVNGTRGIVIDLRNNPGGYLDAAVEVASEFLSEGSTVVTERFADGTENPYPAQGSGRLADTPIVVLVNSGSASASEIVAGALQDYGIGQLVGTTTFGKGTVQQLEDLDHGASLKVTVAKWLTPQGRSISEKGITPDVQVTISADDAAAGKDPQLDKAIELLQDAAK